MALNVLADLYFEIGAAHLKGRDGLLYVNSAVLSEDFCKGLYLDFPLTLVETVEIKKIEVAEERIEITEVFPLQKRLQQEGKLRPNLGFNERGTFPSTVISNDRHSGMPCLAM